MSYEDRDRCSIGRRAVDCIVSGQGKWKGRARRAGE